MKSYQLVVGDLEEDYTAVIHLDDEHPWVLMAVMASKRIKFALDGFATEEAAREFYASHTPPGAVECRVQHLDQFAAEFEVERVEVDDYVKSVH